MSKKNYNERRQKIRNLFVYSFITVYGLHAFCLYIYLIKLNWRNQFKSSILCRLLDGTGLVAVARKSQINNSENQNCCYILIFPSFTIIFVNDLLYYEGLLLLFRLFFFKRRTTNLIYLSQSTYNIKYSDIYVRCKHSDPWRTNKTWRNYRMNAFFLFDSFAKVSRNTIFLSSTS